MLDELSEPLADELPPVDVELPEFVEGDVELELPEPCEEELSEEPDPSVDEESELVLVSPDDC